MIIPLVPLERQHTTCTVQGHTTSFRVQLKYIVTSCTQQGQQIVVRYNFLLPVVACSINNDTFQNVRKENTLKEQSLELRTLIS